MSWRLRYRCPGWLFGLSGSSLVHRRSRSQTGTSTLWTLVALPSVCPPPPPSVLTWTEVPCTLCPVLLGRVGPRWDRPSPTRTLSGLETRSVRRLAGEARSGGWVGVSRQNRTPLGVVPFPVRPVSLVRVRLEPPESLHEPGQVYPRLSVTGVLGFALLLSRCLRPFGDLLRSSPVPGFSGGNRIHVRQSRPPSHIPAHDTGSGSVSLCRRSAWRPTDAPSQRTEHKGWGGVSFR